jgi:hypothetical protein
VSGGTIQIGPKVPEGSAKGTRLDCSRARGSAAVARSSSGPPIARRRPKLVEDADCRAHESGSPMSEKPRSLAGQAFTAICGLMIILITGLQLHRLHSRLVWVNVALGVTLFTAASVRFVLDLRARRARPWRPPVA